MKHVYVVVGSLSSANDGDSTKLVTVRSSQRKAERVAVAFCREHARGRLSRLGGATHWIKHPSNADYEADPDGCVTAYAAVYARAVL